jgi:hypothetical protein
MKKYVQLKCSVCDRTRDSLIDLKYYSTDKCTITLGCEGRLSPAGYTSDGSTLIGVPPTGLTNWYPRSYVPVGTATLAETALYDTATGSKKQLVLAVSDTALGFTPTSNAVVTLNFVAEQQVAKDYRQYTYRETSAFTIVNGVEDGAAKKVLRYTVTGPTPDLVEVYLDGVKLTRGLAPSDYRLYDGTVGSPVPPNSVLFNSVVSGVAPQVDVIVTKAATLSTLALPFVRSVDDDSRAGLGAWEGIDAVKNPAQAAGPLSRWSLFYCDVTELGTIPVDIKLRLDASTPSTLTDTSGAVTLNPLWAAFLLSRTKVFTELDRQRAKHVPLSALSTNTSYFVIKLIDSERQLLVTEDSAVDVFPPYEVIRYNTSALRKTGLTGNSDSAQLDNLVIVGPDA